MGYESEFCDMNEIDYIFLKLEKKLALIYFFYFTQLNYKILEVIRFNINKILQVFINMFIKHVYNL